MRMTPGAGESVHDDARDPPVIQRLVAAARTGDRSAFGQLVSLHERAVYRTALAALARRQDAEDAAQDAFVVAWQRLPGFRGEASFRTWLLTIAWRKALDRRRTRQRWWQPGASGAPSRDGSSRADVAPDLGADPERAVVARDLLARVEAHIQALAPKLRDTLLLAASGEHTYDQIGIMLGVPVGTVKWRVSEARRLIRALMAAKE
jgi:RNA polymerase sigma-70 factor (ECF subfamily)